MTAQAPRQPKPANPFLNSLDQPAPRLAVLKNTHPVQAEKPAQPRQKPRQRPKKISLPIILGWGIVGLLLVWPLHSGWRPSEPESAPKPKSAPKPIPVQYSHISSAFGPRWGRLHQGIDFAAQAGEPIHAASSGKVTYSGWQPGYGNNIVIEHTANRQTRYAHCARLLVGVGDQVAKGDVIATVGSTGHSTGPHLHFEVIVDGERRNPAWYYPLEAAQRPVFGERAIAGLEGR